jgi:hypothetical protein
MAFIYSRAASWKQEAARGASVSLNGEAGRHVGSEITIAQGQIAATHRTANAELKHRIAAIL